MAEDNEVFIEDDAVVLEDTDDTVRVDAETSNIIPFIMERTIVQKTTANKMKNVGYVHIVTIVVYMDLKFNLLKRKNLVCLLK